MSMNANEAIQKAGSVSGLARILGVTRQAVQQYRKTGIPGRRELELMALRPEWFRKGKP
jgi:predicted transcriptional regulator